MMVLVSIALFLLLPSCFVFGQLPTVCNTPVSLETKTCCPNNCGGEERGACVNIVDLASTQSGNADPDVIEILQNAPNVPEKGTADARYQWPTVVFENVCICKGNYWGVSCDECNFGWWRNDCNDRKPHIVRKSFVSLSTDEKRKFVEATSSLKDEMGIWSVIKEEPANYSSGTVTLENVATYDAFVYLHNNVARDEKCGDINNGVNVDFGHLGPVFPVWHRHYLLLLEREFQRVIGDEFFGLPYWEWEQDDKSPFTEEYFGVPSNVYGPVENVTGDIINPEDWHTVCDLLYRDPDVDCAGSWKPCNPITDRAARRPLQRGGRSTYVSNIVEVMITLAAPLYDAEDEDGKYSIRSPRESFRSRMEGWNSICSAAICIGPRDKSRMHNNMHLWIGGHMSCTPAAINEPMFNMHHTNVDRILESWLQRFTADQIPPYVPESGGHPGHNRNDYMVPFFPLMTAGEQYKVAEEWGYVYDRLISASIPDDDIEDCNDVSTTCPTCDANATCIDCTDDQLCPEPGGVIIVVPTSPAEEDDDSRAAELGLGVGLGIPLLFAIIIIIILIVCLIRNKHGALSKEKGAGTTINT